MTISTAIVESAIDAIHDTDDREIRRSLCDDLKKLVARLAIDMENRIHIATAYAELLNATLDRERARRNTR